MSEEIKGDVVNRTLPPVGMRKSYVDMIVVLGTIDDTFEGHTKRLKKVLLGFEFTDCTHIWDEKKGPERFHHRQKFTLSMGSKSKLRGLLDGLKGEAMTDEQAKNFNIAALLECCLNVNLIKKVSGKGNARVEVASLIGMSDADAEAMPPMVSEPLLFTFAQPFKTEVFNKLPEWIQKEIMSSDEYKELYPSGAQQATAKPAATAAGEAPAKKKNVPF